MAKSTGEAGENPLVPNAKLRQMYTKMFEARMLEESVRKRAAAKGNKRIATIRGHEAVRVSTTIELTEDDLVSDTEPTAGMGLLLGGDGASLLRGFTRGKLEPHKLLVEAGVSRALRGSKDEEERLRLSVGAALALKTQGRKGIVVAYSRKGELTPATWRSILVSAAGLELPILFVVLGRKASQKKEAERAEVCNTARAAGVPAIPVDACDAVALYRVTQESLGRTRSGDGPVLIEAVSWRVEGTRGGVDDPVEHLKDFLVGRKICSPAWFEQIAKTTRGRRLAPR